MKSINKITMLFGYILHWAYMVSTWENISTFHASIDILAVIVIPLGIISGYVHLALQYI